MYKVYAAHPITGLSGDEVLDYYSAIMDRLSGVAFVLCPMTGKGYLSGEKSLAATGYVGPLANDHAIFSRDKWMVSQADIILCDLSGAEKVSIGCVMEIALANSFGKNVVLVMEKGNPHNHSFVKEASTVIYETLDEALKYIKALATSSFYV